jgi:hypothetical protein
MSRRKPTIDAVPIPPAAPQAEVAPAKPTMRYLLNPRTGRVLPRTAALSERQDLVECDASGVPLRPIARKLAREAEREAEERRQRAQALGGQLLVTETADTFGSPNNPVSAPKVDNSDLGELDA